MGRGLQAAVPKQEYIDHIEQKILSVNSKFKGNSDQQLQRVDDQNSSPTYDKDGHY